MAFDISKAVSFGAFDWAKQEGIWKILAAYFVFLLAVTYTSFYFTASILNPLAAIETASTTDFLNTFLHFASFTALLGVISLLGSAAFCYLIMAKALKAKGRTYKEITWEKWLGLIVLEIATGVFALLSIFNLKRLLIAIAAIVALVISIILFGIGGTLSSWAFIPAILLIIISVILAIAYFVIVIINALRLSTATAAYVEKDRRIMDSLKLAWGSGKGNVLNIFTTFIVVGIIAAIISVILGAPATVYSFSKIFTGTAIGTSVAPISQFGLFSDPTYLVLYIPAVLGQAISGVIWIFAIAGIYDAIAPSKGASTKLKAASARRSLKK